MYTLRLLKSVDRWSPSINGTYRLSGATVSAGGAAYVVGDNLTLVGGVFARPAQIIVFTVTAGAVTTFRVLDPGEYTTFPQDAVYVTGGTGTGARFNCTFTQGPVPILTLDQKVLSQIINESKHGGLMSIPRFTTHMCTTVSIIEAFAGGDATSDINLRAIRKYPNEATFPDGDFAAVTRAFWTATDDSVTALTATGGFNVVLDTAAPGLRTRSTMWIYQPQAGNSSVGNPVFAPGDTEVYFRFINSGTDYTNASGIIAIDQVSFYGPAISG